MRLLAGEARKKMTRVNYYAPGGAPQSQHRIQGSPPQLITDQEFRTE